MFGLFQSQTVKWIAILAIVMAAFTAATTIYTLISRGAVADMIIDTQQKTIETQIKTIENMQKIQEITEDAIEQRDKMIEQYDSMFGGTNDLGVDAKDLAPPSIRELLRRLP